MSSFTPGPWFSDEKGNIWRRPVAELYERGGSVAGDHPIAVVLRGHPNWEIGFPVEANARLIAAAPSLLEALRLCYDHCRLYYPEVEHNNVGEAVRSALAKATGA